MFTGIVQHQGTVETLRAEPWGARLVVASGRWSHRPAPGDSIAVNGCCLTVVEAGESLAFDVVPQTLALTTIGALQAGEEVNLEHAVTPATLLGGHVVQGHVDGVGLVVGVDTRGGGWRVRIEAPAAVAPYLLERGSVAVDGVSLTIAAVHAGEGPASASAEAIGSGGASAAVSARQPAHFEVALIPETLARTTLRHRLAGTRVNVEADVMARMVAEQVRRVLAAERASRAAP
jgi:riboflavin synthase